MHSDSFLNLVKIGLSVMVILVALWLLLYTRKKRTAEKQKHLNAGRIARGEQETVMGKEVKGLSHYRNKVSRLELRIIRYARFIHVGNIFLTASAVCLAVLEIYSMLILQWP